MYTFWKQNLISQKIVLWYCKFFHDKVINSVGLNNELWLFGFFWRWKDVKESPARYTIILQTHGRCTNSIESFTVPRKSSQMQWVWRLLYRAVLSWTMKSTANWDRARLRKWPYCKGLSESNQEFYLFKEEIGNMFTPIMGGRGQGSLMPRKGTWIFPGLFTSKVRMEPHLPPPLPAGRGCTVVWWKVKDNSEQWGCCHNRCELARPEPQKDEQSTSAGLTVSAHDWKLTQVPVPAKGKNCGTVDNVS